MFGISVPLAEYYNLKRSHQGYRLKGRTPAQALLEALSKKKLPPTNQDLTKQEDEPVDDVA